MAAIAQAAKADTAHSGCGAADVMNIAVSAILRHLLEVPGRHSLQAAALDAASMLQHPLLSGVWSDSHTTLSVLHLHPCASQKHSMPTACPPPVSLDATAQTCICWWPQHFALKLTCSQHDNSPSRTPTVPCSLPQAAQMQQSMAPRHPQPPRLRLAKEDTPRQSLLPPQLSSPPRTEMLQSSRHSQAPSVKRLEHWKLLRSLSAPPLAPEAVMCCSWR